MKNLLFGFKAFAFVAVCVFSVAACNFRKDYSAQVKTLDSLVTQMDSSSFVLKDIVATSSNSDSALQNLKYIQDNYVGTMPRPMAKMLNLYSIMRTDMEAVGEFSQTLSNQLDTVRKQVIDLRQALQENATHDASDNKITAEYVEEAMQNERKAANGLMENIQRYTAKSESIQKFYRDITPQIQHWVDSIPEKRVK